MFYYPFFHYPFWCSNFTIFSLRDPFKLSPLSFLNDPIIVWVFPYFPALQEVIGHLVLCLPQSQIQPFHQGGLVMFSKKLYFKNKIWVLDMLVYQGIVVLRHMTFDRCICPWSVLSLHCTWSISSIWDWGSYPPPHNIVFTRLPSNDALLVFLHPPGYSFSVFFYLFYSSPHPLKLEYCRAPTWMLFSSVSTLIPEVISSDNS